jgi:hypothetical protein
MPHGAADPPPENSRTPADVPRAAGDAALVLRGESLLTCGHAALDLMAGDAAPDLTGQRADNVRSPPPLR